MYRLWAHTDFGNWDLLHLDFEIGTLILHDPCNAFRGNFEGCGSVSLAHLD